MPNHSRRATGIKTDVKLEQNKKKNIRIIRYTYIVTHKRRAQYHNFAIKTSIKRTHCWLLHIIYSFKYICTVRNNMLLN